MMKRFFVFPLAASLVALFPASVVALPEQAANQAVQHVPACPGPVEPGSARCHAQVVVGDKGAGSSASTPTGYGPAQFRGAYTVSGAAPTGQIVAVVDAYDHPKIKSDLDTYSAYFGISTLPTCSGAISASSVPCFQKVNQSGGSSYPVVNSGWALEIALDVEAAHAMCGNCKILLVETSSNSYSDLMAGIDRAVAMGATVISNSWGSSEFSSEASFDSHLNHPGIAITFSSGDSGYGTSYPAASPYVTAVGGTTLTVSGNAYVSEGAWNGAGSGCSVYESTKPAGQSDALCAHRTIADVSADADPNTGAAVYDSVRFQGRQGWFKVGGTSLASPLIAAVYALAGGVPVATQGNTLPYLNGSSLNLHDVVTGSNGSCGTYLCTAGSGYDGPTGLGTPNGLGAF